MTLPRTYDALFEKYRKHIPLPYIRALAWGESRFNPNSVHSRSKATGLLQVTRVVVDSYNKRHGTSYNLSDMLDPETNVKLAADTLNRIYRSYKKNHPNSLSPNWSNPRWVQLFTLGWNAGYSEKAGLGKVASALENEGRGVTIDNVAEWAAAHPGDVVKYLASPQRVTWSKGVTTKFFRGAETDSQTLADILARLTSKGRRQREADLLSRRTTRPIGPTGPYAKPGHHVALSGFGMFVFAALGVGALFLVSRRRR